MDIEKAFKLKKPEDILRAAQDAEARNCEQHVIRGLWQRYYNAKAELWRNSNEARNTRHA